jgi:hypothetical protein
MERTPWRRRAEEDEDKVEAIWHRLTTVEQRAREIGAREIGAREIARGRRAGKQGIILHLIIV